MQQKELVAAYFNEGKEFILTCILALDPDKHQLFLDFGASDEANQKILDSDKIVFIGSHDRIKVQFAVDNIQRTLFGGYDAFVIPLPSTLFKFQKREYYRLATPLSRPLKCIIPLDNGERGEATIVDLSLGGISMLGFPADDSLDALRTYSSCLIALPDVGTVVATIRIKSIFEITLKNGVRTKRAGCEFVNLVPSMQTLVQRYIVKLERDRRALLPD